jgi:8-oxo-dGTP pyrophosphatase MutT (NUDIX family)
MLTSSDAWFWRRRMWSTFMQVVELSREIPFAVLARVTSWLGSLPEPLRLTRLLLPQILAAGKLQLQLPWRKSSATLTIVKGLARDEYIQALPRKRMAAGVLLRDADDKVVLVEPTYKDTWEIPGGVVEAEESPWVAAERELEEELGLVRRNMPVLVVDYVPDAPDGMPEGLLWIFDGGLLSDAERKGLQCADKEVKSVDLLSIDEAAALTKKSLALRLRVALNAAQAVQAAQSLQAGWVPRVTVYCDGGTPRSQPQPLSEAVVSQTREFVPVP